MRAPLSCHSRSSASISRCRSPDGSCMSGSLHLDVVQREPDRARCRALRPPCARPAGAPGCWPARRPPDRPGPVPEQDSRRPAGSSLRSARLCFGGRHGRQVARRRAHVVLGELAFRDQHLAARRTSHARRIPNRCPRRALRAAGSSGVPSSKRPRLPDGVKTTRASVAAMAGLYGPAMGDGGARPRDGRDRPHRRRRPAAARGIS